MLPRRTVAGMVSIALLIALSGQALAGGWAAVRLDEPPGDVVANEPWQFGFMVLQHDVSPNSDVTPILRAQHQETGEEITATGRQEGAVGHFVAEVTFPRTGEWKWSIEPQPFAETSFETLTVLSSPMANGYSASILIGSCAEPGDVVFPLGDVEPQRATAKSALSPVALGSSTIDVPLPELVATGHAIGLGTSDAAVPIACAEIEDITGGAAGSDELVLGLRGSQDAHNVGVAVLRDEGERTAVSLYLVNPDLPSEALDVAPVTTGKTQTVEMLDGSFAPVSLQAAVGDTVTWVNDSDVTHTVTGDDLAFDDSGLIEPGGSFSLTLDEPGTYNYRCGPHPFMEGTIVVS